MALRNRTLLQRSRALVAGLAVAVGLGAVGAQAMPFAEPGFVPVHDHYGDGDRRYGRDHGRHRGYDRGWGGGDRGWDHGRDDSRRRGHHHHHHHDGGDRGSYRY